MLRQLTKDDEKWRQILRKMNTEFYHQTVSSLQIESFLSKEIGWNLKFFFNQYLRDVRIPVLEYRIDGGKLNYRWNNVVSGFDMPVELMSKKQSLWLYPTESWQTTATTVSKIEIDSDYYINLKKLKKKQN
jgi:hypothetical protein